MATGPQVKEALISRAGIHPPAATYALRYCADAGLIPKGGRGGGRNQPHLEVPHLANILIALLACDPLKDVGRLVPLYRSLVVNYGSETRTLQNSDQLFPGKTLQETSVRFYGGDQLGLLLGLITPTEDTPKTTFGEFIERLIRVADQIAETAAADPMAQIVRVSAKRNTLSASMMTYTPEKSSITIFTPPNPTLFSAVSPWIGVEGSAEIEIFQLLGELAQDTSRKTGTPLFEMAANSPKPGKATPKAETGPTSAKGGPASLLEPTGATDDPATDPSLSKRQGSAEGERKQSPPESRLHGSKPPLIPLRGSKSHVRQHQSRPSAA